jgi:hypothetical protein
MYTVEFESDASVVVIMDEADRHEDVEVVLTDNNEVYIEVYIRQYEESLDSHELICMSYQQLMDLVASINSSEGMFKLQFVRG